MVASSQSYEAYLQEHVFGPLDMRQSFTSQSQANEHGLAAGDRQWVGWPIAAHLPDDRATRPSSFLIASAADLTHVLIAALNDGRHGSGALLSPAGMAAVLQPAVAIGDSGWHSAMGWEIGELEAVRVAAKTGGTANYNFASCGTLRPISCGLLWQWLRSRWDVTCSRRC